MVNMAVAPKGDSIPGADWEFRLAVVNLAKLAFFAFPHAILKETGPRMTPKQAAHVAYATTPLWPVRPCLIPLLDFLDTRELYLGMGNVGIDDDAILSTTLFVSDAWYYSSHLLLVG